MPKALISGITGQDGSYLAELLLEKDYEVHGIVRRASNFNRSRIEHLRANNKLYGKRLFLHYADLGDTTTLRRLFNKIQPDEFYHLAGQSHVGLSFEIPESTASEVGMATLGLLEIARDQDKPLRFYHASTSEIFGQVEDAPQNEQTPVRPASPYGCAKAFATQMARVYRQSYDMFVCNGILYNHESPRRGESFVTRKITRTAAAIALGLEDKLYLGNIDTSRDWGHARDYVRAMWLMLQADQPDDYVVATGKTHTLRELLTIAFACFDLDYEQYVGTDPRFYRPADPVTLCGDPTRIREKLGWQREYNFQQLIEEMCRADYDALKAGQSA